MSNEELRRVLVKFPRILEYKTEKTIRPRLAFLERYGVERKDLAKVGLSGVFGALGLWLQGRWRGRGRGCAVLRRRAPFLMAVVWARWLRACVWRGAARRWCRARRRCWS